MKHIYAVLLFSFVVVACQSGYDRELAINSISIKVEKDFNQPCTLMLDGITVHFVNPDTERTFDEQGYLKGYNYRSTKSEIFVTLSNGFGQDLKSRWVPIYRSGGVVLNDFVKALAMYHDINAIQNPYRIETDAIVVLSGVVVIKRVDGKNISVKYNADFPGKINQ